MTAAERRELVTRPFFITHMPSRAVGHGNHWEMEIQERLAWRFEPSYKYATHNYKMARDNRTTDTP